MLNILIVDDERIEREGIKFLINKYKLEMDVAEAENGIKALEYISANKIDILFTDIKMPFMDGLTLSEKARELNPKLKIIIFSAFGEFDYAKKAIDINVFHYILKPIEVNEFLDVMTKVICLCREEEELKKREEKLIEGYEAGIRYQKEKILMDVLMGVDKSGERLESSGIDLCNTNILMVMLDFKTRFFDSRENDFLNKLPELVKWKFEYLNFNECQSIVLIKLNDAQLDKVTITELGHNIITKVKGVFGENVCIVFSKIIHRVDEIHEEYIEMERMLEYSFFFDAGAVILTGAELFAGSRSPEAIAGSLQDMDRYIEKNEYHNVKTGIEVFFSSLQRSGNFSAIYVKYLCTEIVKKIFENMDKNNTADFQRYVEEIYNSQNLLNIKDILTSLVEKKEAVNSSKDEESNRKVIEGVLVTIHKEYMNDIGLESLASRVYMSPSYLSHLFKKETGQSFMKYITAYRFEKAKELLLSTNMKVIDICEKVGYSNLSYFCSIFKNYYGTSPTQYRERRD